jgi:hypothetical protein
MSAPLSPAALLEVASKLCQRADATTAGLWPRAAALLARQALEAALGYYWAGASLSAVADCPMRTQLACLWEIGGRDVAGPVRSTWAGLSSACHMHPYELAPTAPELLTWMQAVDRFCRQWGPDERYESDP